MSDPKIVIFLKNNVVTDIEIPDELNVDVELRDFDDFEGCEVCGAKDKGWYRANDGQPDQMDLCKEHYEEYKKNPAGFMAEVEVGVSTDTEVDEEQAMEQLTNRQKQQMMFIDQSTKGRSIRLQVTCDTCGTKQEVMGKKARELLLKHAGHDTWTKLV